MTSTITLYYGSASQPWELLANKLFKVEDIDAYLNQFTNKLVISDFQYVKQALEVNIKVNVSQSLASATWNLNDVKYVSIRANVPLTTPPTPKEKVGYYFVRKTTWRSTSCVEFELVLDVLNTYNENTDYAFKPSTRITREHKDRMCIRHIRLELQDVVIDDAGGSLGEDDEVVVKLQTTPDPTEVCRGTITFWDDDKMILKLSDDVNLATIREAVENGITSSILFSVEKDNANYVDIYPAYFDLNYDYMRIIDHIAENINPLLYKYRDIKIERSSPINVDWYLLYRNRDNPDPDTLDNPVECYLIPSEEKEVKSSDIIAGRLNATSLNLSYYYYVELTATLNWSNQTMTLDNGVVLSPNPDSSIKTWVVLKRNADNTISVECFEGGLASTEVLGVWTCKYVTLNNSPFYYYTSPTYVSGGAYDIGQHFENEYYYDWTDTTSPYMLDPVSKIDKTDPKNIKLIKLPYCPYTFSISGGAINVISDANWDYVALQQADNSYIYALKLNDLNLKLQATFADSNVNFLSIFKAGDSTNNMASINQLRVAYSLQNGTLESKLLNSEFCTPKIVYDSFSMEVDLERLDNDYYYDISHQAFYLIFTMTRTINSKFMFQIKDLTYKLPNENYPNVLSVARNNEEVLYNVPYINYIRTGFNYDVKAKNLSTTSNWVGVGLSGVAIGASLLAPSVPLKVAGVVGSLVSMAVSIKGAITSQIQGEEALKQKLMQAENQKASVLGSDDVDLMSEYSGNRAKYVLYMPNEVMFDMLNDLFFYAGYASGRMGLPNHERRVNFDYLECDAVIESIGANMSQDIINELINSFKVGVTYIHKTSRNTNKWDMKQEYENFERSIMEVL